MPRIKTKTSSFGTSKREGHDATQFYSSNLYNGLKIDEKQEIIDHSDLLSPSMYIDNTDFSLESIKNVPDHTVHLIIFDCSSNLNHNAIRSHVENYFTSLFLEFYRILITGGKICLIIDNHEQLNTKDIFYPFHAFLTLELVKSGFLMRGEVIWKKDETKVAEKPVIQNEISNLKAIYKHIIIYSKQISKREKNMNTDTISRDQFLQYTKSIWKHQPELITEVNDNIDSDKELFDCYYHIMQLYSFESDRILFLIPDSVSKIIPISRLIRKNIIGYKYGKNSFDT